MTLNKIFVDFTKAFDIVNGEALYKILRKQVFTEHLVVFVLYAEMKASVNLKEL